MDINRDDQTYYENTREQTPRDLQTFDEMTKYLLLQKNCSIQGSFFTVLDLHSYVNNAVEMVKLIDPDKRQNNIMCTTTKRTLQKVFDAFIDNKVDVVGVKRKKWGH